ncbi:MAG: zf-TFIIB domain-containing protein [Deltaproteobacteria bacterium]|nr:zf-TFIIB domain-containing protein [Deltaproteobacteria bacterium]
MLCPICNVDLLLADRQGIEIDYCPKCRGIWLDRGELEKLIERSASSDNNSSENQGYRDFRSDHEHNKPEKHHGHGKRRESWVSRVFDFD